MSAPAEDAAPAPLPTADILRRHALMVAVRDARQKEAAANLAAVRGAAELVFAPVRNHGTTQQEVRLADGTKVGLISIDKGADSTDTDEDALFLVAAGNEPADLEDFVQPAALTDPRVLALLSERLPELVGRRIKHDAAALYAKEIEDNRGMVLDRSGMLGPAGERVRVATITTHDATGKFSFRPTTKGLQQVREALDAGLLTEDGEYVTPALEPDEVADFIPDPIPAPVAATPAVDRPEETDEARYERAMARSGITRPKLDHAPTDEQAAVLEAVATGESTAVRALAGTGKTTTLQHVGRQERNRRGMYLAFGHDIVAEAKAEGKFGDDVKVTTAHALAMGAVGRRYKAKMDGAALVPMWQVARILRINSPLMAGDKKLAPHQLARLTMQAVEGFCQSADPEITAAHVPVRRGLDSPEQLGQLQHVVLPWARRAWADLTEDPRKGELRFDHSHYLKLWQLSHPTLRADYIMFDEAQDADPVILDVVKRQAAQIIPVGDDNQGIFEWRNAVNALDEFDVRHALTLTQSFRFGHSIAAEANKWLAVLGSPLRVRGWERRTSMVGKLAAADAVLCRSNTGAMAEVIRAITAGEKTALAGGDKAAGELRRLAEAAAELKAGLGTSHPELVAFATWRQVQEYAEEDASGNLRTLVRIVDEHGPEKIIEIIGQLRDEKDASVVVSTAHRGKGRQWYSVRISDDFREPAGEIEPEEGRLAYVAITRAMGSLDRGSLAYIDDHVPAAVA